MNNVLGKKIYYVANLRMPTERAHGVQLAKMCESLLSAGADLELIVPDRTNAITISSREFYALRRDIPTTKLGVLNTYLYGKLGFWVGSISFMIAAFWYLWKKERRGEQFVVYTIDMDQFSFAFLPFLSSQLAVEIHDAKKPGILYRKLFSKAGIIVVINNLIKEALIREFKLSQEKIMVFPNGIDLSFFEKGSEAPSEIRETKGKRIVLYVGKFYGWKGMEILLEAAKQLRTDTVFAIVGGSREEFEKTVQRKIPEQIICLGQKPYQDIPRYLAAADILLVLGTKNNDYSYYFTSPMKLFEYMAANRPIIASDTPAIRQIVGEKEAFLYPADDAASLAKTVDIVLNSPILQQEKSRAAYDKVKEYSWQRRAELVLARLARIT